MSTDVTNSNDAEFHDFALLASELERQYKPDDSSWSGSPFNWIRARSSRQVGAIGERLIAMWCEDKGFEVGRSPDSEADLVVKGYRIEVKLSTRWTDTGVYRFQQIRDQNYDFCLCLGISPFDVHAWLIPKKELMAAGHKEVRPQHGGQAGRDTRWLTFPADDPPNWLAQFGGSLTLVTEMLGDLVKRV